MVEVNNLSSKNEKEMVVTKTQADFLDFCQKYGWGKVEVTIVRGEPVASKELERTHRHDVP